MFVYKNHTIETKKLPPCRLPGFEDEGSDLYVVTGPTYQGSGKNLDEQIARIDWYVNLTEKRDRFCQEHPEWSSLAEDFCIYIKLGDTYDKAVKMVEMYHVG